MILAAFFLPLAVYLLALGHVNRRPAPLVVSGTADAVGLLFGLSGFLILGGPAVLTALQERWRMLWLLADAGPVRDSLDGARPWWAAAAAAYFLAVVGGCVWHLARSRALTSVYNVEPEAVRAALGAMGLSTGAEGGSYHFGDGVTLEVEAFETMKHVTLRWTPADAPPRRALERELGARLEGAGAPGHDGGLLLTTAGMGVLLLAVAAVAAVSLRAALGG